MEKKKKKKREPKYGAISSWEKGANPTTTKVWVILKFNLTLFYIYF